LLATTATAPPGTLETSLRIQALIEAGNARNLMFSSDFSIGPQLVHNQRPGYMQREKNMSEFLYDAVCPDDNDHTIALACVKRVGWRR
jgi:hypothetical protein